MFINIGRQELLNIPHLYAASQPSVLSKIKSGMYTLKNRDDDRVAASAEIGLTFFNLFHIPDPSQNVEEYVIAKDFVERFLATLTEKDRQIVELRQDGFTYEEIADRLGYKNHSGVIKRVEAVKKKLQKYRRSV